jgi:hypothetical protein
MKFIILLVTGDAGDDGEYNGSVIGSYEGSIEAESYEVALKKVGQMLEEKFDGDIEYFFKDSYVELDGCQYFVMEDTPFVIIT